MCGRYHAIEARLARWLLMTQDRAHATQFEMTQHYMAVLLGVRRAGVTQAAGALQQRGLIRYARGRMTVVDRPGLKKAACSCYGADNTMYERVMR